MLNGYKSGAGKTRAIFQTGAPREIGLIYSGPRRGEHQARTFKNHFIIFENIIFG